MEDFRTRQERRGRRGIRVRRLALRCAAAALIAGAVSAGAAPAPWHQWRSRIDGRLACAQTSPGAGWEQAGGPYRDAECRQPLRVIRL